LALELLDPFLESADTPARARQQEWHQHEVSYNADNQ
jgi:hypothetical protein